MHRPDNDHAVRLVFREGWAAKVCRVPAQTEASRFLGRRH